LMNVTPKPAAAATNTQRRMINAMFAVSLGSGVGGLRSFHCKPRAPKAEVHR
jgi:hypothetical protein